MKVIDGGLDGKGLRFTIIAGRFNDFITSKLVDGAVDALVRHGVRDDDITLVRVPGAFEIPLVASRVAADKKADAIICLGAVIRGATPHFDYVASEVSKGVAQASLVTGVPIAFGVLTTESIEQAVERAGSKSGNKGWDSALSAIEMVQVLKKL